MSKEMIISVNGREKKIAILDNGRVTEFYIERGEENAGIAGNIYKGRVQRVLPGMQSAFVSIGLERDAFLYVSDFFDEEEEIERIVMEKSKKTSPEEAKREAKEQVDRARVEREKQMEAVQDIAEPMRDSGGIGGGGEIDEPGAEQPQQPAREDSATREPSGRKERGGRGRRQQRDRKNEQAAAAPEASPAAPTGEGLPAIEFDSSGFERVVDDDDDTGELFKDAFRQEAIVDKVRAVEFDIEGTEPAKVGSLLSEVVSGGDIGFERIADDDDESSQPAPAKKPARARRGKAKADAATESGDEQPAKSAKSTGRAKSGRSRKAVKASDEAEGPTPEAPAYSDSSTAEAADLDRPVDALPTADETEDDSLPDAEASVRESADIAEMAVRRGGRGRRRNRGRRNDSAGGEGSAESDEAADEDEGEEITAQPPTSVDDEGLAATPASPAGDGESETGETEVAPADRESDRPAAEPRGGGGSGAAATQREPRGPRSSERSGSGRAPRGTGGDGKRFERGDRRGERAAQPTISDLLREGQEILVQIAKEPIARKGARITSHIALPGRYLVYMPTIEHLGVSRKIESASERARLRTLIQRIRQDETIPSGGFIVRTAGVGISEEDLRQDARYLVRTWQDVKKTSERAKSPALVHQDLDLVQRLLRDQLSDEFTAIRVDSEEEYLRTVEFINRMQPRMVNRVKLYTREEPILDTYGVQEEVDKALKPRVWLKSGGYLVINQTEALVAIDVNTGKFVGKGNARLEDTITRTNMEAVDEIARQIRLRDLGGIIVLDLIDMEDRRNRHKVSQALQEALQSDKSPTKVLSFNDFGLIIMTRKRVKQSLERTMCSPCEYCEGAGWVKSAQTVCYEVLTEARSLSKHLDDVRQTTLRVHPDVAKSLRGPERHVLEEIEAYLGSVDLNADPTVHQAQFDFAFI